MSSFPDFWARRKAKVAAEDAALEQAQEFATREADVAEKSDDQILEELGLPDPDTLQAGDDFSAFMAKAVPDRIRRRALRMLWRSNPVLANVDGLIDYGEDFTDSAMVVENLQTAYQVGKGMLAHIEKLAADAEAKENPPEPAEAEPENEVIVAATTEPEPTPMPVETQPDEAPEDFVPAPRRMTFTFESDTA